MKIAKINELDSENLYWNPGCATILYKPKIRDLIYNMLLKYYPKIKIHDTCCHHSHKLPKDSIIINICSGCDSRFRNMHNDVKTISLWEVLDSIEELELPNYKGLTLSVHDSCGYKDREEEHLALRNVLGKMNIDIIESEFSGARSICCGDNFYGKISIDKLNELQKKRAKQMPCEEVAVQCVTCIKSMAIGNKIPRYVPDLLLNQRTELQTLDMDLYHKELKCLIEKRT